MHNFKIGDKFVNTLNNIIGTIEEKDYTQHIISYSVEGLFTEIKGARTETIKEKVNTTQLKALIKKGILKRI